MDKVAAQAGLSWRKSTRSQQGNCLEVAFSGTDWLLRDSKNRGGPTLALTTAEWRAFLEGAKAGEFDEALY